MLITAGEEVLKNVDNFREGNGMMSVRRGLRFHNLGPRRANFNNNVLISL